MTRALIGVSYVAYKIMLTQAIYFELPGMYIHIINWHNPSTLDADSLNRLIEFSFVRCVAP